MDKKNKHDVIVHAIERLNKSAFKLTGVKVELEAQFGRMNRGSDCYDCSNSGERTCPTCDGDNEDVTRCEDCNTTGWITIEEDEVRCTSCDGSGYLDCNNELCNEGYVPCDSCSGDNERNWRDERVCHDYILEKLVPLGLAERIPSGYPYSYARKFRPTGALVFSKFYNDHSVDSEWTFTLKSDDPEVLFILPKMLNIFKELGMEIGNVFDTQGAGMHMAFLNGSDACYPMEITDNQAAMFQNFRKSMQLLLPALYFLGSSSEVSRPLRFRQPRVERHTGEGKYWAINYGGSAVEFRVFETCYETPDVILDNLVVMANCMRYWSKKYHSPGLHKKVRQVTFGHDYDNRLERFYVKKEHIELLNNGLRIIKPSYLTIKQVKQQRKFGVTKKTIDKKLKERKQQIVAEYKEYEQRFEWSLVVQKNRTLNDMIQSHTYSSMNPNEDMQRILEDFEARADREVERNKRDKKSPTTYEEEALREYDRSLQADWTLEGVA